MRNRGIEKARGKYLCFIDNDDLIIESALKKIYNAAEKFHADILHFDKYFAVSEDFQNSSLEPAPELLARKSIHKEVVPKILTSDIQLRIDNFLEGLFMWEPWNNIIRREFLLKNNLKFPPNLHICDDLLLIFTALCTAKNVVIMPDAFYIWRNRKNSASRKVIAQAMSDEDTVKKIGNDALNGLMFINKFFDRQKFFIDNPNAKYPFLEFFLNFQMSGMYHAYKTDDISKLDKIIRAEIESLDDKNALLAILFNHNNKQYLMRQVQSKENKQLRTRIQEIEEENSKLRKIGMRMIELANYRSVEVQNIKSVISDDVLLQTAKD